ncbi:MAG TPA: hypothetical protein VK509_16930, partial [Polyangiales bacterium]|nr:hypothetical protein [Polyangiales bacterium]
MIGVATAALFSCADGTTRSSPDFDAGTVCVDEDRDGFGRNCAMGQDCDDRTAAITNQCLACAHNESGCACRSDQQPVACFLPDQSLDDGAVMCREGTRHCRGGKWSGCEDVHNYVVTPDPSATSLINADAAPKNCSICDLRCFKVEDPLLAEDGGAGSNVSYPGGGGLRLAPIDAGGGAGSGGTGGSGAPLMGCAGLTVCCDTLRGRPEAEGECRVIAGAMPVNDANCNAALEVYCPSVIDGPVDGCTIGSGTLDSDCDGIPDTLDECTKDTIATNPRCNGSTLPLTTTNNQTIFHVLDEGETGSNSVELGFRVRNADVYFLMDMSNTMSDERDKLVNSMITGNVVECALLKNCCTKLTVASERAACITTVEGDDSTQCGNAETRYCSAFPELTNCPDLDFDGDPDNELKTQGVVGAVRCLVGSAYFGAGTFDEIPFSDGLNSIDNDTAGAFRDRGHRDEWAFKHYVDMTSNYSRVRDAIASFRTNGNLDYPEADMVGLHSLLTGKGQMFGHNSPSIPERLGLGCDSNTFGYPCFRRDTVPIVMLFTDDPMNNGPAVYTPASGQSTATYDATYKLNGKAPSSGVARFTPVQAESFATAYNLGDVRNQFVIAGGDTRYMKGDYPAVVTGCGAETNAPDVVYRFAVE